MSVIMTLRAKGDPDALERRAAGNPEAIRAISDRARQHGLIAHRFYGSQDGQIMVVDEWPDQTSFEAFFSEMQSEIEPLMRDIGVTSAPEVTFWRKLESHDEVGWGAEAPASTGTTGA
jgi:heme-degrading monooxygenase HmoA